MRDLEFREPAARSTLSPISSVRPWPHSTLPPTLPIRPVALDTRRVLWAESSCPVRVAAVDRPRPQASGRLLMSLPGRPVPVRPDASENASETLRTAPDYPRSLRIYRNRLRKLQAQPASP